jgi:tyrosyl-DNA phosphodiesterase 2
MSDTNSSDENDDANLPSAAECDRRCKEFAAITSTDTALAMFYLQDRDWSLEVQRAIALNAVYIKLC